MQLSLLLCGILVFLKNLKPVRYLYRDLVLLDGIRQFLSIRFAGNVMVSVCSLCLMNSL